MKWTSLTKQYIKYLIFSSLCKCAWQIRGKGFLSFLDMEVTSFVIFGFFSGNTWCIVLGFDCPSPSCPRPKTLLQSKSPSHTAKRVTLQPSAAFRSHGKPAPQVKLYLTGRLYNCLRVQLKQLFTYPKAIFKDSCEEHMRKILRWRLWKYSTKVPIFV